MNKQKLYAIIDGASEEELMPMLAKLDPPATCLYAPPIQPDLVDIAPYVVLVDDDVKEWLDARETPWGIYITTDADLKTIRSHLRKYLYVLLPDSDKPVFFRFYDPRNIWMLTSVLTDWELHSFMGPIEKIETNFKGTNHADTFATRRKQYPQDAVSNKSIMSLTQEQYDEMIKDFEKRYIKKLAKQIPENDESIPEEFASKIFYYLKKLGIDDDRSIRGITTLLTENECYSILSMPREYKTRLEDTSTPGYYRVERLLLDELGSVPE